MITNWKKVSHSDVHNDNEEELKIAAKEYNNDTLCGFGSRIFHISFFSWAGEDSRRSR